MNSPKLTVVVPIYNVSQFLRQCIDSILNQTMEDLEVILVNDESPDPEDHVICQEYAEKNEHVSYIKHEVNKGLGGARNTGLFAAKAPYIAFIDSDDWLEPTMFEELCRAAIKKDADIAQCYFYQQQEGKTRVQRLKAFRHQADEMNAINVLAWNKVYKTSLYLDNNILYPEKIASQDVATMTRLLYFVDRVALVRKPLYNYRINRKGSLTSKYAKLLTDLPVVFQVIEDFLKEQGRLESDRIFLEKRVMHSVNHHLARFQKDTSMSQEEKDALIREKLHDSTRFLSLPGKEKLTDLNTALKHLKAYKRKVEFKIFLKEMAFLLTKPFR